MEGIETQTPQQKSVNKKNIESQKRAIQLVKTKNGSSVENN